ncbi:MAG: TIGR01458 family HAD-type hydrolase [candidate division Zixibacteria bacterium]
MRKFEDIKGVLFDLDGVLYIGNQIIPGAVEAIEYLRQKQIPCRFSTNTTTKSRGVLFRKITSLGLPIKQEEIISAPQAAIRYLRKIGQPKCYLCLNDDLKDDFSEFAQTDTNPDYVIIGDIWDKWNYEIMNRIFRFLIEGAELIALHKGRYWREPDGLHIDIGVFITGLEYASGKKAIVIGKPSPEFFTAAVEDMNLAPAEVIMIGDDIESDVGGAQNAGLRGVLVKTGKYREDLVSKSKIVPDAIIDSVAQLSKLI